MTPETERRIALEIEHYQAFLTIEEKWLRGQPYSAARDESFRRIKWWRRQFDRAKAAIGETDDQKHWTASDWKAWAQGNG